MVGAPVVEAAQRERRAVGAGLGGVVVDDVEDHLDAGVVEGLDHRLELRDLLAAVARRAVRRVRGEEAQGVVAPVVAQPARGHGRLGAELVHRQQLDRGHAQVAEVVHDRGRGQPGVRAAQVLGHPVVQGGHALDVQLVDHGVAPAVAQRALAAPVEVVVGHDDRERHVGGRVEAAGLRGDGDVVGVDRGAGAELAADRAGVGVDQQLLDVEAPALVGGPPTVDPEAVAGAGRHARDRAVPDPGGLLGEGVPRLDVLVVDQRDPDGVGVRGVHREVGRLLAPGRPERPAPARPDGGAVVTISPQPRVHAGHSLPRPVRRRPR